MKVRIEIKLNTNILMIVPMDVPIKYGILKNHISNVAKGVSKGEFDFFN